MKQLLIVTTGDFSREVYWHAKNSIGYGVNFMVKGFLEGNLSCDYSKYTNLPAEVLGNIESYEFEDDDVFVIANASGRLKSILVDMIEKKGGKFINLIHKTSIVAESAKIGEDVIIGPFVSVSVDTTIGNHVMLNSYTSIGHDASIGDYTSIMAHVDITGKVKVGVGTYWGSGSRALPSSKIGDHAKIGAGSVVLKKVKAGQTVFGVPATAI